MKFLFNGKPFSGVTTALVTPFDENNVIDDAKMKALVDWQIENGIKGLLVLGGSGEYVSFTMEERIHAIESAVAAAAGRIPAYLNRVSVRQLRPPRHSRKLAPQSRWSLPLTTSTPHRRASTNSLRNSTKASTAPSWFTIFPTRMSPISSPPPLPAWLRMSPTAAASRNVR